VYVCVRASPRFNVGATQVVERFVTRCIITGLRPNGRCNKLIGYRGAKPRDNLRAANSSCTSPDACKYVDEKIEGA